MNVDLLLANIVASVGANDAKEEPILVLLARFPQMCCVFAKVRHNKANHDDYTS